MIRNDKKKLVFALIFCLIALLFWGYRYYVENQNKLVKTEIIMHQAKLKNIYEGLHDTAHRPLSLYDLIANMSFDLGDFIICANDPNITPYLRKKDISIDTFQKYVQYQLSYNPDGKWQVVELVGSPRVPQRFIITEDGAIKAVR